MKAILVAVLGLTACATMSSPSGNGTASAQAGACAPATVSGNAVVYSSPDDTSQPVAKLSDRSRVCADAESTGFGFRHVKLENGKEGYVAASNLI